ncbi:MAG: amidohydrolase family protein [Pseudomonadaceae bacterium]|nr:amidohydrolase family protein [Pseudomonadaceae bacterium]
MNHFTAVRAAILGLLALFLLVPAVQVGADDALPLQPTRSVAFTVTQATWMSIDVSPDGSWIVLDVLGDLYRLPIDGGEAVRLTQGMAFDSQPVISPDGSTIAAVSDRSGTEGIWLFDADGGNPRELTKGGALDEFASPTFSPDGQHVVVSKSSWKLSANELWAYHIDGGRGVRLTQAKAKSDTPRSRRHNALGAVYSPDGRYLYYGRRVGGFAYNASFPMWQIARRDLANGTEDVLTQAVGSGLRPVLSPDGKQLVYGTRRQQQTELRLRDLSSGHDRSLVFPIVRDDQEARFTRDTLPRYDFTPDGRELIFTRDGRLQRLAIASGEITEIPMTIAIEQQLGPELVFPYRIGVGPVKARLLMSPALSPDGESAVFTAFLRVYRHDFKTGETRPVTPVDMPAFQASFSPDGRDIVFASWDSGEGHLYRMRASGRGKPKQLTREPGFYSDPAFSPDGQQVVALRGSAHNRLYNPGALGSPVGTQLVVLPSGGGESSVVLPARKLTAPHFGPEPDRIYAYHAQGLYGSGTSGLVSMRFDGSDQRRHVRLTGQGIYFSEGDVPATDMQISPDGRHALALHANQLHVLRLLNTHMRGVSVKLAKPVLPIARLTDVGADYARWSADGQTILWATGNKLYRRALADVEFSPSPAQSGEDEPVDVEAGETVDLASVEESADRPTASDEEMRETHESVSAATIDLYLPRAEPEGVLALVDARVIPMAGDDASEVIEDGVIVLERGRITAVGTRGSVAVPAGADIVSLAGKTVVPGYVDTHAHLRPTRRVLDRDDWGLRANLAYGVTTAIDVQPGTIDILAYEDLVDAGLVVGPRTLSTGPGLFSNNSFRSEEHARSVLRRYKEAYRVHNLKAYISGSRQQRQYLVAAAKDLKLMATTEGALDMKLNLTHIADGFTGQEHPYPLVELYEDSISYIAQSGIAYTPTLLVGYGGPWAENYFYTRESPRFDKKLARFTPPQVLAAKTLRRPWFAEEEYVFDEMAAQAHRIMRAGGRIGVGAHGQLQGLGYHWELWALSMGGFTPFEALRAATRHGAEMIGIGQDAGSIEPGKLADLVILNRDPLEDIRASADIDAVVKHGVMYDGETLDERWPQQRVTPVAPWIAPESEAPQR